MVAAKAGEPWFVTPAPGEEPLYRFGDIVEAPWLVAIYLQDDARRIQRLGSPDKNGGERCLLMQLGEPLPENKNNLVQAHADDLVACHGLTRRGMILSDDCDIVSRRRNNRGRIRLVSVADMPTDPKALEDVLKHADHFGRMVIDETKDPAGVGFRIDFPQTFSLSVEALTKTTVALRPANEYIRDFILRHWCAQAARHGPRVAEDGVEKLAKLIEANGVASEIERLKPRGTHPQKAISDAVAPLENMLLYAWVLEGKLLNRVADDLDAGSPPRPVAQDLLNLLEQIANAVEQARIGISGLLPPPDVGVPRRDNAPTPPPATATGRAAST